MMGAVVAEVGSKDGGREGGREATSKCIGPDLFAAWWTDILSRRILFGLAKNQDFVKPQIASPHIFKNTITIIF